MIKVDFHPHEQQLRNFGFIALFGFSLMAVMVLWRFTDWQFNWVVYTLFGLAAISPILSMIAPKANLPVYLLLTVVSLPIGFIVSPILLRLVYYGLLTPMALWFRLIGRDSMDRAWDAEAKTYWKDHRDQTNPRQPSSYLRLY